MISHIRVTSSQGKEWATLEVNSQNLSLMISINGATGQFSLSSGSPDEEAMINTMQALSEAMRAIRVE